jgi:WD40 repeat protein
MFYSKMKATSVWSAACAAVVAAGLFAPCIARDEEKKAAPLEVRKVLSMATDKPNDFRKAVIVASSEHKSVLSRNLIVSDPEDRKAGTSGLHLWTLDGDKPKRTNLGDGTRLGFIPKSTLCYAVDWGAGVILYDTRTHAEVGKRFPHELREDTMPLPAVSPDGEILATRSKLDHVQFWNIKTGKAIAPATAVRDIIFKLEFTADGKWLFSHDESGDLNVWDPTTGTRSGGPFRHNSHYPLLFDVGSYSPKARQLVTSENGGEKDAEWKSEAIVRSSKTWGVVQRLKMDGFIRQVNWLDDTHLLIATEEKPKLDDRGRPLDDLGRPALSGPHLLHLATLSGDKAEIRAVHRGGRELAFFTVAPDGKHFIASSNCWKLGEPKPIWTKPVGSTVQFGDGGWLLARTNGGGAAVYSLADGAELWRRQEKLEDVKVQGSDIWIFTQKAVEVWRVGVKAR